MAYKKGDEMVIKWKTKLLLGKLSANFDGNEGDRCNKRQLRRLRGDSCR